MVRRNLASRSYGLRTDGETDIARSTWLVIVINILNVLYILYGVGLIKNIHMYILCGVGNDTLYRKRFFLPVTYFPTNELYPFTLPVKYPFTLRVSTILLYE